MITLVSLVLCGIRLENSTFLSCFAACALRRDVIIFYLSYRESKKWDAAEGRAIRSVFGLKEGLGVLLHAFKVISVQACAKGNLSCLLFSD